MPVGATPLPNTSMLPTRDFNDTQQDRILSRSDENRRGFRELVGAGGQASLTTRFAGRTRSTFSVVGERKAGLVVELR